MPLAPGTTIGRYRIESRIGAGAMGVVYLALDTRLERRVALKLIEPSLAADAEFRSRFEREARAAAGLDHPHVLPVYEAGEDDEQLYLAMRYVPGVDLATRLARHGPLDLPATTRLVTQLAAALDAAHATGLIHRDVKPANVLLAPGEHAYLADFGLARSAGPGITRPGQLVGTADYTAPELLRGESASAASDVYALACLAVECLTGRPPFSRDGELATLYAHAHDPIPALSAQRPELPPVLQAVIERGLAKEPAERYPSAGELAAALDGAAGGGPTERGAPPVSPTRRPRLRLTPVAVMGVILVVAGSGAGWVLWSGRLGPPDVTEVNSGSAPGEEIPAGSYRPQFTPPLTLDVPVGWRLYIDEPDAFSMSTEAEDESGFVVIARIQTVYRGQCRNMGTERIADDSNAVIDWLEDHPVLVVSSDPYPVTVGDTSGLELEMRVPELEPCPDDPFPGTPARAYLFPTTGEPLTLSGQFDFRVRVVEFSGHAVTVLAWGEPLFVSRHLVPLLDSIQRVP